METTAKAADWREQMDLTTPHELRKNNDPVYYNLFGPNQWPSADLLPDFREVFETYMQKLSTISMDFTRLIAECLGLPAIAFDQFFDENQYLCDGLARDCDCADGCDRQHKLKIVKYPDHGTGRGQGVGRMFCRSTEIMGTMTYAD